MKSIKYLVLLIFVYACSNSKNESGFIEKDSVIGNVDSVQQSQVVSKNDDLRTDSLVHEDNIKSGYFLLINEESVGDTLIKGMYLKFDNKKGFFFLFDEKNKKRIELEFSDYKLSSNDLSMSGHNENLKITFSGKLLVNDEEWNNVIPGETVVLRGDLKLNESVFKNMNFIWTIGE